MAPAEFCDFLVLGGGASGCVVARRLSDAGYEVILVEAGADPLANGSTLRERCLNPLRAAELWGSGGWMAAATPGATSGDERTDFAFETEPEQALGGRRIPLSCGRALGGGTAINNGLYGVAWAEPQRNPWIEWADAFGLQEWHPEALMPCVHRAAAVIAPQPPAETERLRIFDNAFNAAADGTTGIQAVRGVDYRVSWCVNAHGERVTAAQAYLRPANGTTLGIRLRVLTRAQAMHLEFEERSDSNQAALACIGAFVCIRDSHGAEPQWTTFRARREVVVCCGPIMTPAMLLRSGIGPRDDLLEAAVRLRVDSPHVGRNLITQPTLPLRPKEGAEPLPAAVPTLQPVAPAKAPLGQGLELAFFAWPQLGLLYALGLNTPLARGDVRLPSGAGKIDDAQPRIRLGLLGHAYDRERFVSGLAKARAVASKLGGPVPALPEPDAGEDELTQWIQARVSSTRHPLGTCRMGHAVSDGVCDSRGRVLSSDGYVPGLRVADNSLAPSPPPDSHVMRLALAIAERVSEFVLEDHASTSDIKRMASL